MLIRKKLLSGLVLLFALLASSIALTVHYMVLPVVAEAERTELARDINQIKYAIRGELDRLLNFAIDWGEWDDTYAYIQSPYPAYETSNLLPATLKDVKASIVVLIDTQGRVVNRLESKRIAGLVMVQESIWTPQHPVMRLFHDANTGLLNTEHGPLLIAGNPIRMSNGDGPDLGHIVFGRFLDQELQDAFAQDLLLPMEISVVPHQGLDSQVIFKSSNSSQIMGYMPFSNDINNRLQLSLMHDRPFYTSALQLVSVSMVLLLVVGSLATGIAYFMIRRTLVDPIVTLKLQAELFKRSKSSLGIQEIMQNDELGALSRSFMDMVRELEASNNVLEQERQKFLDDSLTDPLTRLGNRRFLQQYLRTQKTAGEGSWMFIMIDLDHFKSVNDRYGHHVGDNVLSEVAGLLMNVNRSNDMVIRFGGEEFVVVCHGVNRESASGIAERIRTTVESHVFYSSTGESFHITCSIGFFVLEVDGLRVAEDWSSMLKVSDLAMYAAKRSGRNIWVGVTPPGNNCPGEYPSSPDQMEFCIDNRYLVVLTCRPRKLNWG